MLREVCVRLENTIDFDKLFSDTGGDYLQIAEYLFLKADKRIGPIRHQLERSLTSHQDVTLSGNHVELVNLGAPQIYTTNYDDLIESTLRTLDVPAQVVVLPKDVALADSDRVQVVKYHGDLQHEQTLVLTESAYYRRLDFESPMDLKFRSDLLGKSVLFMGYSFRDINIRIIWFKLMEMMRDIPEADRRPSYIVRLGPNPALEELYAAVGLRTIVLKPDATTAKQDQLGRFLLSLSMAASEGNLIPGTARKTFQSASLLGKIEENCEHLEGITKGSQFRRHGLGYELLLGQGRSGEIERMVSSEVPVALQAKFRHVASRALPFVRFDDNREPAELLVRLGSSKALTQYVVQALSAQGVVALRKFKRTLPPDRAFWVDVWSEFISRELAAQILLSFEQEIEFQETTAADEDIAYLADLAWRLVRGQLKVDPQLSLPIDGQDDTDIDVKAKAEDLLARASEIYSDIRELQTDPEGPPQLDGLVAKIDKRSSSFGSGPSARVAQVHRRVHQS